MFTGIVEEVGDIRAVDLGNPLETFIIGAAIVLDGSRPGDSIAINGTCLTITGLTDVTFAVGVMPESLRRTTLGSLRSGDRVNLERPVQPTSRLGGHFVQGHIDGTGRVAAVVPDGSALRVTIETPPEILKYIVEKGFIAVDGVSLTVTQVDASGFGIALIRYTQDHIASGLFTPGKQVNLEVDILAKYVEKLVIH